MDEDAKKAALRTIPYGLYVIGVRNATVTDAAQDLHAFIGSWVSQCSFKPPLVMIGVRRDARSHAMIQESGVFTLNLLGPNQKDVAQTFFKNLDVNADQMSGHPYTVGETGAPIFPGLPAYLECRLVAVHEHGGDHDVFVGQVVAAGVHAAHELAPLTHKETGWHYAG